MISMRQFARGRSPRVDELRRDQQLRREDPQRAPPALMIVFSDSEEDGAEEYENAANVDFDRRELIPNPLPLEGLLNQLQNNEAEKVMDWSDLIAQQVSRANSKSEENQIFSDDALRILETQRFCCASCGDELDTITRTVKRRAWNKASLDRIDVFVTGYGNGNAQWLCVHCNLGKNSTENSVHLAKMYSRAAALEDRMLAVEEENRQWKTLVEGLKEKLQEAYRHR